MEYYFNELSIPTEADKHIILQQIKDFVMTCRDLKKIEFDTLRADRNIRHIQINGKLVVEWLKNETALRQRLAAFDSKYPYIREDDIDKENIEWQTVSWNGKEGFGLRAAHLKNSLVVSFPSNDDWKKTEIEAQHEFLTESVDKAIKENISIKNASLPEHCKIHKPFAIQKLKQDKPPEDWEPDKKYLPRVNISNKLLNIDEFYGKKGNPVVAESLQIGKDVAELNFYIKNDELTNLNSTKHKIRHIYESKNVSGKKRYLSIDIKGRFEVCDESGTHLEEILFNEENNGNAKPSTHSIKLKK